jgi:crotonobetainyl-CoA:carnitine CoA-transferase CaiB-like acyl-CoA transferase
VRNKAFVDEVLGGWLAERTNAEIIDVLGGKVSVGPVRRARDWVDDPHVAAREMLVRVDHPHHRPTVQLGCPIKFTATPSGIYRRPPFLDEHGDELRGELQERPRSGPAGT